MLFVGTSIIHPSTEGVFLLCNILDLLIYSYIMMKHEKSNKEKKIEIPDNQIVYDQRKVINQTIAIRRKRSLENKRRVAISKCINIVSFLLIAAAVLFLLRVLQIKEFGQINQKRIFQNLQRFYKENGIIIAVHAKKNLLVIQKAVASTVFSCIVPNFVYFSVGLQELPGRISTNIHVKEGIKQIWNCAAVNIQVIVAGIRKFISIISNNLWYVLDKVQEIVTKLIRKK